MHSLNPPILEEWPIWRGFKPTDILTWWHGRPVTLTEFFIQSWTLSERLPTSGAVLNLSDDRAAFALGWAAALLRGLPTVLPSDKTQRAITNAAEAGQATCLLIDRPSAWDLPGSIRRIQVDFDGNTTGEHAALPVIPGDRIAAILYTSGSTGRPKPAVKRWSSLVSGAHALGRMLGWHETRVTRHVIGAIAPQHMFGLESTVMLPLQWGASINPARPLLPADLDAALSAQTRESWLMMTPLHATTYLGEHLDCKGRLSGAISSTMPLPAETAIALEALWQTPVHEIYGSTETGMIGLRRTCKSPEWQLADDLNLDFSSPQPVVTGRAGMPAHTLNDRVEEREARRFTLMGRNTDIVKVGGKRASITELNALLSGLPGVSDAVMVLPEEGGRLTALVVAEFGVDAPEIRRRLAQKIDPVFLPRPLWLVESLPRNDNGKLPRQALLDLITRLQAS
jgi:acyl-coenzyme A synthetase/AMP-(fatty) acid ligase